jgi:hypothetical protein
MHVCGVWVADSSNFGNLSTNYFSTYRTECIITEHNKYYYTFVKKTCMGYDGRADLQYSFIKIAVNKYTTYRFDGINVRKRALINGIWPGKIFV